MVTVGNSKESLENNSRLSVFVTGKESVLNKLINWEELNVYAKSTWVRMELNDKNGDDTYSIILCNNDSLRLSWELFVAYIKHCILSLREKIGF